MKSIINKMIKNAKMTKDLQLMEAIYNGNKDNNIVKFEYAKMLINAGHYIKARALLLELLDSYNADYALTELAIVEKQVGNIPQAKEYFEYLADKGDEVGIFELGKIAVQECDFKRAKELFLQVMNNNPKNFARLELGKIEARQGNIDEARMYFSDAIKYQKQIPAKIALGKMEESIGNIEEARRIFNNIKNVDKNVSGSFELGKLEKSLGNIEEARKIFTDIYKNEGFLCAKIELGKLEESVGNFAKAEEHFLSLEGTYIERFAYHFLILLYNNQQKPDLAFYYIKKAIDKGNWVNPVLIVDICQRLNIFFNIDYESFSYNYVLNQLLDYDPYLAVEHIIERHQKEKNSDFKSDIDIYSLFNKIKGQLTDNNKEMGLDFNDIYSILYNEVGARQENYLKVITLPNTKNIITMFPNCTKDDFYNQDILDDSYSEYVRELTK